MPKLPAAIVDPDADDVALEALRHHLEGHGLTGRVQTPAASSLRNARYSREGHEACNFGLPCEQVPEPDVFDAVHRAAGCTVVDGDDGMIDTDLTLRALRYQRARLASAARRRQRVLFGSGHSWALTEHYQRIAGRLVEAGCDVPTPASGAELGDGMTLDYDRLVASYRRDDRCHSHLCGAMHAMLAGLGDGPDLVVGDHGFAGAAIAAGIETLAIADINDAGLLVADHLGWVAGTIVIDDGFGPEVYSPLTDYLLDWSTLAV